MYIPRQIEEKLIHASQTRPAVLVTGARQTGKTTLLKKTFPSVQYVTFDNILLAEAAKESPKNFFPVFPDRSYSMKSSMFLNFFGH